MSSKSSNGARVVRSMFPACAVALALLVPSGASGQPVSFAQLSRPVGVAIDAQGNVVTTSDATFNTLVSKFSSSTGQLLGQIPFGTVYSIESLGYLATDGVSVLDLFSNGSLWAIDPASMQMAPLIHVGTIPTDTSSAYFPELGTTGPVTLGIPTYGDIAVIHPGGGIDSEIYIAGLSGAARPFILRITVPTNPALPLSAKVIMSTYLSTGGGPDQDGLKLTRGIAINAQGTLLTTMPRVVGTGGHVNDVAYAVNVAYFRSGQGDPPRMLFDGAPVTSRGMATDAAGNFYIATGIAGTLLCGPTASGPVVRLTAALEGIACGFINGFNVNNADVAVNPAGTQIYVTHVGGDRVWRFNVTPPTPCSFTLSASSDSKPAAGGAGSIGVTTANNCAWTATSNANWITIDSGASGLGNGTVSYTVATNTGGARSGTLTIAGRTVTVQQAAAAPGCSFGLAPTAANAAASGGSGSIGVTAAPGCSWSAASSATFLSITSGASGAGNGTINYTASANLAPQSRSATITVAGQVFTLTQGAASSTDADNDTLPDEWEERFGLSTASAAGVNGRDGDPDADARTNAQEYAAGTHPRGFHARYLAEGALNAWFDVRLALLNVGTTAAHVQARFLQPGGATAEIVSTLPPLLRRTLGRDEIGPLLTSPDFSTVVESDQPIVVDRTMSWDATGYGSHAETGVPNPSTTWYLAEGSTSGDFALFYLLQNPNANATTVTVRYLLPFGQAPIERTYALAANARLTIPVDAQGAALASTDVSAVITAPVPIIAERAMYLDKPGRPFAAGHESAGVTATATKWFLAEGATGPFFDLFILLANPNPQAAAVTITYLLTNGATHTKSYTVPANGRFTVWVDDEQLPAGSGVKPLQNVAVSSTVTSTNGVPIIVERTMWWPGPGLTADFWTEAHNSAGATVTGTRWALAEGEVGGPLGAETYILIANTSLTAGEVRVTLYFEDGSSAARTVTVPASSRTNVSASTSFPEAAGRRFGAIVESVGTTPVEIVVERAMYTSPGGVAWAGGTDALATRLP
jgi:hypothetical protein